ncbi:AAA domain-containing protein [Entophlyctis helioformis]|nr:AAA domain-containing protein [Entophlyctis helioformis]
MDVDYDSDGSEQPVERTPRKLPNILITGTPGTGKTTTSEMAAMATGLKHVEVGKLVKEKQLHDGYDAEFDSYILNEDKVVDELEDIMAPGGVIVDHHGCDFFPERWFDLVVVLTCDNNTLYQRLENRKYSEKKIQENVECEIMRVVADEASTSYKQDVLIELASNTVEEMESNVNHIEEWVERFIEEHAHLDI